MTSPAKQRLSLAGIGRVLFCALAGALVCSVLLVFLEGFRWIDRTSESGGFVHNFFWISLLVLNQMFLTPWGAIGALLGTGVAWLTLSVRLRPVATIQSGGSSANPRLFVMPRIRWMKPNSDVPVTAPRVSLKPGELLLGLGLVAIIGSVVFVHFVMGWLLAVPMVVLAMILLLIGVINARDRSATADRQCAGIGLLLSGIVVLFVSAFMAAAFSLDVAISVPQPQFAARHGGLIPGIGQFLGLWGGWLLAPLLMNSGLSLWTNWSTRRRICWCLIILGVPPCALVVHQILVALGGPLTA